MARLRRHIYIIINLKRNQQTNTIIVTKTDQDNCINDWLKIIAEQIWIPAWQKQYTAPSHEQYTAYSYEQYSL